MSQYYQVSLSKILFLHFLPAVSSHLKVHGHSSVCSLLSDQGDWHKMVSSSQLIDDDLVSLKRTNPSF